MPTTLMEGVGQSIYQGISYALPGKVTRIQSLHPLETSIDGTTWSALTGAELGGADTGALFVRSPTANTTIVCKRASEQPKIPVSAYEQNYVFGIGNIPTTVGTGSYTMVPIDGYLTSAVFTGNNSLTANDTNYLTFGIKHWDLNNVVQPDLLAIVDANTTKVTGGNTIQAGSPRQLILGSNLAVKANERIQPNVAITGTLANTVSFPIFNMKFSPYPPGTSSVPVGEYQPTEETLCSPPWNSGTSGNAGAHTLAPLSGTLTKAEFSSATPLAADDANYIQLAIQKFDRDTGAWVHMLAGVPENSSKLTGGFAFPGNYLVRTLVLISTPANLKVKQGDRLYCNSAITGTITSNSSICLNLTFVKN